ncbi:Abscisic acid 8'-hydroxylase 3 [Armadillidium vulgare]|nr:Abscisic acid 8'-hydroxylase 3 [Armadillidium vulgare]
MGSRHCSMISMEFQIHSNDVKIQGYDIPKLKENNVPGNLEDFIFPLAALSHRDPTYFKDPEKFDPSRFLDDNGKYIPTCDGFQAFGIESVLSCIRIKRYDSEYLIHISAEL